MPKIMNTEELLKEIEVVFPFVEMPHETELIFHKSGCHECDGLQRDLEEYRGKEVTGELIRCVHQELSCLSEKSWQWILPHYLRFCLTPEAQYNQMETEFLIYSLSPDLKYQKETLQRLLFLNKTQINCLVGFMEWCKNQYREELFSDRAGKAINFLLSITPRESLPLQGQE